jgi:NAD(P)-dependent dehydrogenase (short-subunit alcohol dehydrogenase family)
MLGGSFTAVPADAADPTAAGQLIDAYRPGILVLNAGATSLPRPIHHHTWQTFSSNWDTDVQQAFNVTREALLAPLAPGSTVIALSGGYAGCSRKGARGPGRW